MQKNTGQNRVPSHEKFQTVRQDKREFPQQRLFERPQRTLQFTGRGWTLLCGRHGFGTSVASVTSFEPELSAMAEILLRKSKDSLPDWKRKKKWPLCIQRPQEPSFKITGTNKLSARLEDTKSLVFLYTSTEQS